ncbi:MAG TPA: uroporphyrinogen-III synthase [Macromonas sp.]|nr:uroporphyrinogen-III synthase [Macromonas sp.]
MTTLVLTRPRAEAQRWQEALGAAGWAVLALPLIDIDPPADNEVLARSRAVWAQYDAVMFVSAQAVTHFLAGVPPTHGPAHCWAPGPGTARALLQWGVPVERIDAPAADAEQFDSEALWAVVRSQVHPGHRLLVVRGDSAGASRPEGSGRDWLARQCQAAGGQVDWCVAYQRRAPQWDAGTCLLARQHAADGSVWLFSSSEAVAHLGRLCPGQRWDAARALVTHPRIAQAVRELGFGEIMTTRPALADVLRHLESLH